MNNINGDEVSHGCLYELVQQTMTLNKRYREFVDVRGFYSLSEFLALMGTVSIGLGRQTGKTGVIAECMRAEDVAVVYHELEVDVIRRIKPWATVFYTKRYCLDDFVDYLSVRGERLGNVYVEHGINLIKSHDDHVRLCQAMAEVADYDSSLVILDFF